MGHRGSGGRQVARELASNHVSQSHHVQDAISSSQNGAEHSGAIEEYGML